jgi:hypothetical protein
LKNLVLGSIVALFLGSCSFSVLNGYHRGCDDGTIAPVSWFLADSGYLLLNTRIDMLNNHFSGLMVVKPLPNLEYRVVFITEIGLKIWDFEFSPHKPVKVHYIMDALNRKKILKTLFQDIGLMLMTVTENEKPVVLRDRSTGELVFKYKERGLRYYYHNFTGTGRAANALVASRLIKKAKADFYSSDGFRIDSVKLAHYKVKLRIQLFRIEDTNHAGQ